MIDIDKLLDANPDKVVVIDYHKKIGCTPCKMIDLLISTVSKDYPDVVIEKISLEEAGENFFASKGVRSCPTLQFYKNKELLKTSIGALTAKQFKEILDELNS